VSDEKFEVFFFRGEELGAYAMEGRSALAILSASSSPGMTVWKRTEMNEIEVLLLVKEDNSRTWVREL